jgi:hypothetical protein
MVLGTTSSGKSTFINCLLQRNILPEAYGPCTSSVCEIRYGKNPRMDAKNMHPVSSPVTCHSPVAVHNTRANGWRKWIPAAASFWSQEGTGEELMEGQGDFVNIPWPTPDMSDPLKVDLRAWLAPKVCDHGNRYDFVRLSIPVDFLSSGLTIWDSPGLGDAHGDLTAAFLPLATACIVMINGSNGFDRSIAKIFEGKEPLISPKKCLFLVSHMDEAIQKQRGRHADIKKSLSSCSDTKDAEDAMDKLFHGMDSHLDICGGWSEDQVQTVNLKMALTTIINSQDETSQVMIESDLAQALHKVSNLFSENLYEHVEESCWKALSYLRCYKKEVMAQASVCRLDAWTRNERLAKWIKFSGIWEENSKLINRDVSAFWVESMANTMQEWKRAVFCCSVSAEEVQSTQDFFLNFIQVASEIKIDATVDELIKWEKEVAEKVRNVFEEQLYSYTKQTLFNAKASLYSKLSKELCPLQAQYYDFEFKDLVSLGLDADSLVDSQDVDSLIQDKIKIQVIF